MSSKCVIFIKSINWPCAHIKAWMTRQDRVFGRIRANVIIIIQDGILSALNDVKSVKELKAEANQSSGPTSDTFVVENLTGQKALDLFHTSPESKRCADCQNDCKFKPCIMSISYLLSAQMLTGPPSISAS